RSEDMRACTIATVRLTGVQSQSWPEGLQLFSRNAAFENPADGLVGLVEERHDEKVVDDEPVIADAVHRHSEKGLSAGSVEDSRQLEACFFDRQIRELRGFAGSIDRNPPMTGGCQRLDRKSTRLN